ncbi:hypothetical protein WJX75_002849 [Coccomyxa subellipsoidea]|uniref:HD domain-containing protein n=1 Tax=Coccomyxa subellipsoidea TaxID=248742 RepID=A0ABR2YXG8_9CHLO
MLRSGTSAAKAIDFLHLLQNLKVTKRTGWIRCNVKGPESIADHMYRMGMMSLIAGDAGVNTDRCIRLSIVHDVAEAIVGDITPNDGISKEQKRKLESDAIVEIQKMLGTGSAAGQQVKELFEEYEDGRTAEALLVKDFDKLEMILQAQEYEKAQGINLQEFFDSTKGKFQTELGRSWAAEIEDKIRIEVEQGSVHSLWRGHFSSTNIEDITARAGSFKKGAVFFKMLQSALAQESASVHVDVLTYSDLASVQAQPGSASSGAPGRNILPSNKRYLILTYTSEFDCTHYPFPLAHVEHSDRRHLKEVDPHANPSRAQRGSGGGPELHLELARLRDENSILRKELTLAKAVRSPQPDGAPGDFQAAEAVKEIQLLRQECAAQQQRLDMAQAELAEERSAHRRDMRRKNKELAETQEEVVRLKEQVRELRVKCREACLQADSSRQRGLARLSLGPRQPFSTHTDREDASWDGRRRPAAQSASVSMPTSRANSPGPQLRPPSPAASQASMPLPGRMRSVSRPRSAPPRPGRFDPTQFVREKRERERLAAARLQGGQSVPRSPRCFGWPGWTHSSEDGDSHHSRPSSGEARERDSLSGRRWRDRSPDLERPRGRAANTENAQPNLRIQGRFLSPAKRASSPGRALQDVKARLSQFAAAQGPGGQSSPTRQKAPHQV